MVSAANRGFRGGGTVRGARSATSRVGGDASSAPVPTCSDGQAVAEELASSRYVRTGDLRLGQSRTGPRAPAPGHSCSPVAAVTASRVIRTDGRTPPRLGRLLPAAQCWSGFYVAILVGTSLTGRSGAPFGTGTAARAAAAALGALSLTLLAVSVRLRREGGAARGSSPHRLAALWVAADSSSWSYRPIWSCAWPLPLGMIPCGCFWTRGRCAEVCCGPLSR